MTPSAASRRDVLITAADNYAGPARPGLAASLAGIVTPTDPTRIVSLFGALVAARAVVHRAPSRAELVCAQDEVEWLLDALIGEAAA